MYNQYMYMYMCDCVWACPTMGWSCHREDSVTAGWMEWSTATGFRQTQKAHKWDMDLCRSQLNPGSCYIDKILQVRFESETSANRRIGSFSRGFVNSCYVSNKETRKATILRRSKFGGICIFHHISYVITGRYFSSHDKPTAVVKQQRLTPLKGIITYYMLPGQSTWIYPCHPMGKEKLALSASRRLGVDMRYLSTILMHSDERIES